MRQDIQRTLHEIAAPAVANREQVRQCVLMTVRPSPRQTPLAPLRVVAAMVATLVFGVLTAFAYWTLDDGLTHILDNNLFTVVDQQQIVGDTVVNMDWAYADRARIMLMYTIEGGAEARDMRLSSPAGYPLGRYGRGIDTLPDETSTQTLHTVYQSLPRDLETLPLRLQMTLPEGRADFTFEVPIIRGDRFVVEQTQTVNGETLRLVNLFTTPSYTLMDVCFAPSVPLSGGNRWVVEAEAVIDGEPFSWNTGSELEAVMNSNHYHYDAEAGAYCAVLSFPVVEPETISLTVERVWLAGPDTTAEAPALDGPWTFEVQ